MLETKVRENADSDSVSEKGNDKQWLEAAMMGGEIDEVMLNGSEIISDFADDEAFGSFDEEPYDPNEFDQMEAQEDINRLKDEDLEPEFRDG